MFRRVHLASAGLSGLLTVAVSSIGVAGPNDVTPQRFGTCQNADAPPCQGVVLNEQGFRSFARELGVATAFYAMQPAETTGLSGFAFQLEYNHTSIAHNESYWKLANVDQNPSSSLSVMNLHVRKGLPMSLEIGANAGIVLGSDMVTLGGEIKYALHEDTLWPLPDLAIRAWGNALFGAKDLGLYNVGGDVILSVPFGIGGAVQVTPFGGYALQAVISKTNVLDATPGDPMPPVTNPTNPSLSNAPEFVFDVDTQLIHRMFVGLRLSVAVVDLTLQGTFLGGQTTVSAGLGASF